jgi:hypothetical protein
MIPGTFSANCIRIFNKSSCEKRQRDLSLGLELTEPQLAGLAVAILNVLQHKMLRVYSPRRLTRAADAPEGVSKDGHPKPDNPVKWKDDAAQSLSNDAIISASMARVLSGKGEAGCWLYCRTLSRAN